MDYLLRTKEFLDLLQNNLILGTRTKKLLTVIDIYKSIIKLKFLKFKI